MAESQPQNRHPDTSSDPRIINVLLTTFPGLSLPRTINLPLPSNTPFSALHIHIASLLPQNISTANLQLHTTTTHTQCSPTSTSRLSTLTRDCHPFLPLTLHHATPGGKGGFGSQLRAAGGRMSSRKKKDSDTAAANSSRTLEGRRLRTMGEAKSLANYLAVKPDMDREAKEERKKRWEGVVKYAEERAEEVRKGKGRGDGKWVEEKEEAEGRVREGIRSAMERGLVGYVGAGSSEESAGSEGGSGSGGGSVSPDREIEEEEGGKSRVDKGKAKKIFGWDDEDEDMSDSEEDEE